MSTPKARYVLAHITTSDLEMVEQNSLVNQSYGYTQQEIYKAGLDFLEAKHNSIKPGPEDNT